VGLGTFKPLTAAQLATGTLHEERYDVPVATWSALEACRARGGRVVAIGTTSVRVLESATGPGPGVTSIFLRAPGDLRVVDVLFTNFHLPGSSLLMLVTAFGGHERVMGAYRHAVDQGYRFYSYGDACLVVRGERAG
jgi:S-adenosylmethionine:tRNA ribosyltransferase-isomerase